MAVLKRSNAVAARPYGEQIYERSLLRYAVGLAPRARSYAVQSLCRFVARRRGAVIGKNSVIHWNLARKAGPNLVMGCSCIVEKEAKLDLRNPIVMGDGVIINNGVTILRASHNVDDPFFPTTFYGLEIGDYVWLCTGSAVLPSVSRIGHGAVLGAFSVLGARTVEPMQILAGNPAQPVRARKSVHDRVVVEAMKAGDLPLYWKYRKWFRFSAPKHED